MGSILCLIFFNIHFCDLFFIVNDTEIANFADDNTPYISAGNIEGLAKSLESITYRIYKWLSDKRRFSSNRK